MEVWACVVFATLARIVQAVPVKEVSLREVRLSPYVPVLAFHSWLLMALEMSLAVVVQLLAVCVSPSILASLPMRCRV